MLSLYPALRNQEGRPHGARHGKTEAQKTVPYRLQRVEEMSQKSWRPGRTLRRNSRSFSQRQCLPRTATRNWLDRAEVHRYGQVGTGGPLLPSIQRWIPEISKTVVISHKTNRARMHRCDSDQTSELQSQSRTISTENQAKNVQNPFYFNNTKDGTLLPQVILGGTGTHPKAGWNSWVQFIF